MVSALSSSSSYGSYHLRAASPEYGIPTLCYGGAQAILLTSKNTNNPARRFYTCRNSENSASHVWKWWDEAVMEELGLIRTETQELGVCCGQITRKICEEGETSGKDDVRIYFADELVTVKEVQTANSVEIAGMKKSLRGNYVMVAASVLIAAIVFFFK